MIIEHIMKRNVITVTETSTIKEAMQLLEYHQIRHIPVLNAQKQLVGIVSDSDIRDASPSIFHFTEHLEDFLKPISSIMKRNVITAHPLDFVEEVSTLFYEHHIGCLPILDDEELVGIITETDMLHTLVELMGAHQPSSHIEVKVENITGKLSDIASIFKELNISITSVLVYPHQDPAFKILVFRIQTIDPRKVVKVIEEEGYDVIWPSVPGMK
ncbi:acetoin utilization AcuB family protein [Alkalihalobacillus sp. MEB130]|uniref:acetoin utilization AcuB family protein n=1 Tax=Alkalihalobacillus sp. MEB130 TaxID=2976704 RepID=UPI0028DE72E8|nr:acetoin utilization AcuB family protein [Alkalihalobacillus sp. MEB130]MDT8859369.1 acetoin utilization AcuB family protein [Alkalihalobacillus sp. MEB130]